MTIFLVIVIVLLALVFGISSIAQSVATAKQAQATIETAKAAQMATAANTAVIITAMIVILAILFLVVYLIVTRSNGQKRTTAYRFEGANARHARALASPKPKAAANLETLKNSDYYDWLIQADPAELNEFEKDLLDYLESDR